MDTNPTATASLLQLHRAGAELLARALSRDDQCIAGTPPFDEERDLAANLIADSIERARMLAIEREETAEGFDIEGDPS